MSNEQFTEAKAGGLTDEEIEYLRQPIKADQFVNKHSLSNDTIQKMIGSGELRAVLCREVLWVRDAHVQTPAGIDSATNFLENLWNGKLGLAITYWVYGVLGAFVWAVAILALDLEQESDSRKILIFLMMSYYVVVYVGIWRAASKYRGNRLWEILAKFLIVIIALPVIIRFLK